MNHLIELLKHALKSSSFFLFINLGRNSYFFVQIHSIIRHHWNEKISTPLHALDTLIMFDVHEMSTEKERAKK